MKVRDSGMPEQEYWESLLDVDAILDAVGLDPQIRDVVEIGCGYGTFSVPVAQRISGFLDTYDIEPEMVALTQERLRRAGVTNAAVHLRDVIASGFTKEDRTVDAVLLFNILHAENPKSLLHASADLLRPGGRVIAIHWRSDVKTPRGPELTIRPRPEQLAMWAADTGLLEIDREATIVPPWHFAMSFMRRS